MSILWTGVKKGDLVTKDKRHSPVRPEDIGVAMEDLVTGFSGGGNRMVRVKFHGKAATKVSLFDITLVSDILNVHRRKIGEGLSNMAKWRTAAKKAGLNLPKGK